MKLNLLKAWYSFVLIFFVCSERIEFFHFLEGTHIKHYLVIASVIFSIPFINGKKLKQFKEFTPIIVNAGVLYTISLFLQITKGHFKMYSVYEIYYFLLPLAFIIILYNSTMENYIESYLDVYFYGISVALFIILLRSGNLSPRNIISLFNLRNLFIDSISSVKETDMGVFFAMFYLYYHYKGEKTKRILSFIFCFLAYKRIAVLSIFAGFFIFRIIPKHKKISAPIYYITIFAFILAPFAVYYMCDDSFAQWFYSKTGLNFNQFTMSRFEIINAVIDKHLTNYGLGTVNNFLERRGISGQLNMHNDILKIYMECGLLGTIVFTTTYFKTAKDNIYKFCLMAFIFLELFGAHFLASGSVSFWILVYLIMFQINHDEERLREENKEALQAQMLTT